MLRVRDDRPLDGIQLDILRHRFVARPAHPAYWYSDPMTYPDRFEKGLLL